MEERAKRSPSKDFPAPKRRDERDRTVSERIPQFLERLGSIEPSSVFPETMREIRELKAHYALRYSRVALTRYRAAVQERFGDDHPAAKYLHSFRRDQDAINSTTRAKVHAQHLDLRPIDPDDFIARATDHIDGSTDRVTYGSLVSSLCLLTGRRPVEIGVTGTFELVEGRDDILRFTGQAKGKNVEKPPFIIPVLADAALIVAAHEKARSLKTFEDEKDFNSKAAKLLGDATRSLFGDYTPKQLRQIYSTIAYYDYTQDRDDTDRGSHLSQPAYTAKILGHNPGDITTALSYIAFYVEGSFDDTVLGFAEGLPDMLEWLDERRNAPQTTDHQRTFIDVDIAKVQQLRESFPVPARRESDVESIDKLTANQQRVLAEVVAGRTAYARSERTTVEALEKRGLLIVENDASDRFATAQLRLTSRGAELGALIAVASPDATAAALDLAQQLPIFTPNATAVIQLREHYRPDFEQRFEVLGRDAGATRVYGRNGNAILSIAARAFTIPSSVGDIRSIVAGPNGLDNVSAVVRDNLPILKLSARDIVEQREHYRAEFEQSVEIVGRSADGARIYGRNGAALLSISSDTFKAMPEVGDRVSIRGEKDGRDVATIYRRGQDLGRS